MPAQNSRRPAARRSTGALREGKKAARRANKDTKRLEAASTMSRGEKHSRPPFARMARLHQLIAAEKFPNCRSLAQELEVSSKTIQRDIDFMRDRMGMPIEYHQTEFGFYFTKAVTHFPTLEISEGEMVALFIAQQALAQHRGTSFEAPLRAACEKLAAALPAGMRGSLPELAAAVSFRTAGVSPAGVGVFEAVNRAVQGSVEVAFQYHKLGSEQWEMRRVRPYHVACVQNQWYCIGHDLDREELRTFALPRMREVKLTRAKFERPANFSIERHLGASFGVFRGADAGRVHRIRIRFSGRAARLVPERIWHEAQEIQQAGAGKVELRLELSGLEEIAGWVLSWGEEAEVMSPKALREMIRTAAARIAARG